MPILLTEGRRYTRQKAELSDERRKLLELAEQEIAADPDHPLDIQPFEGYFVHRSDFLTVTFQRTGKYEGKLVAFRFLGDSPARNHEPSVSLVK